MPTQLLGDGAGDEGVPVLAGLDRDRRRPPQALARRSADAARRDLHDGAVEAVVGDDEVAAAAEHQHRLAGVVGGRHRVDELGLGGRLDPARGRTAEPQRGPVGQPLDRVGHWHARPPAACPSTFWPPQVTSSSIVATPVLDALDDAADLDHRRRRRRRARRPAW